MSDLSNLLGDVYGDHSSADAAPVRHEPPAVERVDLTAFSAPAPAPAPMPMVDLSYAEAPAAPAFVAPSVSVSAPVPAMAGGSLWSAGDDDIFPGVKGTKKKK
jgi:hypothetical protein